MTVSNRPLCVDLDGTLLRSDILYESLLALLAHNPLYVFLLPFWLLKGKAHVKRQLASRVKLPAETLPYDERVLEILRTTTQRPRVLCTASDRLLVQPIADHLGLFEEVMASDGRTNLSGSNKGEALAARFGERGFDYMGNGQVDLKVWAHAGGAFVVNNGPALARAAARQTEVLAHLPSQNGGLLTWVKALRVYQWLKNLLVLVPLLTAHRFFDLTSIIDAGVAFLAFGLCASGVYLLNDLLDLTPDRMHPRKRKRPFAAGTLPLLQGLLVAPLITLAGFALALVCSPAFAAVLLCYYVMTLSYSLKLKRIVMIDVVMLAALYTVRIIGGTVAINSELSFWLLAFSMFVFLSLAMLKRYTELASALASGKEMAIGRGYSVSDLPLVQSLGAAAGYIGVLVFALYINSPESLELYTNPKLLWLLCPILLYWISRMWIVSHRGDMHDDPIVFAAMDRGSQIVIGLCVLIVLLAI
ncbi:TPA: UbiA family prenyltransferase [Stenotrophomonas maltophilia]|nr:UbiA family prenyltransferase [Stenotrophomonas maltophilia]HDS1025785.1 UbiA family prenyltransferase [Stenotrophomonas maltophilia]HDS1029929.1 UbiA family prenyltransferase [Stenotrophomonas maltophilia]HDS1034477.1 UbiA family prenyltransferase [Stenotrophomonas maltophilia]HDS1038564.1 UbiA family prenyltransferase [Stenotrophomonas maltophilia]